MPNIANTVVWLNQDFQQICGYATLTHINATMFNEYDICHNHFCNNQFKIAIFKLWRLNLQKAMWWTSKR